MASHLVAFVWRVDFDKMSFVLNANSFCLEPS